MSYRLIDANAIAALWPEANDMPCIYADLPSGLDGGHYDMRESDELQRENAKLWELVRIMAYCMQYERECDGCRLNGADGTITAPVGCDGLLDRIRDLEVDE